MNSDLYEELVAIRGYAVRNGRDPDEILDELLNEQNQYAKKEARDVQICKFCSN